MHVEWMAELPYKLRVNIILSSLLRMAHSTMDAMSSVVFLASLHAIKRLLEYFCSSYTCAWKNLP